MIYLVLCILCSSVLVFMFKVFDHFKIEAYPAIVFNYITCVICGFLNSPASPVQVLTESSHANWLWLAVVLGISFIHVFSLTGKTALRFGVSTASVAMKLGLVIPVALAFFVYHEEVTWYKIAGITCAIVAVVLSSYKESGEEEHHAKVKGAALLMPLLVFVTSGLCDSGAQLSTKVYFPNGGSDYFVLIVFLCAALTGICYMSYYIITGSIKLRWQQVAGGIALGIPNYGSLLFLMKALDKVEGGSSVVFPVTNIATVGGATLLSVIFFKEHLNKYNRLGLVFACLCIVFIYLLKIKALLNLG
ncbi:MAG: EamA-like transporter family [Bacteroidetes bacterium]|nr:EamA-like transporter family [Bacteroidota bacterium]